MALKLKRDGNSCVWGSKVDLERLKTGKKGEVADPGKESYARKIDERGNPRTEDNVPGPEARCDEREKIRVWLGSKLSGTVALEVTWRSRQKRSNVRHAEIRRAMDTRKVTFEQANKQAYIRSNTRYAVREIVHELQDYQKYQ
jgi:hypothetical protein